MGLKTMEDGGHVAKMKKNMETQDGLYKEGNKEPFIYHPISLIGISMNLP